MRLSEISTEDYGYTISVFVILASCQYVLSETYNSIPTMHWRWTIKFALVFTHELTNSPKWLYHEICNFSFCVILMKLLNTITFLPLESSFNFFSLRFHLKVFSTCHLNSLHTYLFNRPHWSHKYFSRFLSYVKIGNFELKRKPPKLALLKDVFQHFLISVWS